MPAPRPNPELMVIGDSLPQGCRSLSVTAAFCAQSWPARMAAAQGWEFVTPDHPRPVLFQLEDEILTFLNVKALVTGHKLEGFVGRLRANLAAWLRNDRESAFPCFDNVAVAGALIFDLYRQKATTAQQTINDATANGTSLFDIAHMDVPALHNAINARFVLNPSQDPEFAEFTQLEWVRARLPKRLVVQIGHNHGLYEIGSKARIPGGGVTGDHPSEGAYFVQWEELARQLADLPDEVGLILVGLLPKVGAVANLRPKGAERVDGYATAYEPVFAVSNNSLSGEELAGVDTSIREANARIRGIVLAAAGARAGRVKFVDVYDLFERFDMKNSRDAGKRLGVPDRPTVDNQYIDRTLTIRGLQLTAGGFESADGMHASAVGYALLASEVMEMLGMPHDRGALLQRAFDDDPLLTRKSLNLDALVGVLGLIRRTQLDLSLDLPEALSTDQLSISRVVRMMQSVFTRQA